MNNLKLFSNGKFLLKQQTKAKTYQNKIIYFLLWENTTEKAKRRKI